MNKVVIVSLLFSAVFASTTTTPEPVPVPSAVGPLPDALPAEPLALHPAVASTTTTPEPVTVSPTARIRLRLRGPADAPVALHPAVYRGPSIASLEETRVRLMASMTSDSITPGHLVRALVEFAMAQVHVFRLKSVDSYESAHLAERFRVSTLVLTTNVIDQFKTGLRREMRNPVDLGSQRQLGEHLRALKAADPETTLGLRELFASDAPAHQHFCLHSTLERVRLTVDTQESLLLRYMAAFPLVKRMFEVIDAIDRSYGHGEWDPVLRAVHGRRH